MARTCRSRSSWLFRFALILLAMAAMSDLLGGAWLALFNGMPTVVFLGAEAVAALDGAFFIALLG